MKVTPLELPGVLLVEPRVFGDVRGYFLESYSVGRYAAAGLPENFVQDNVSRSKRGVLRGLHFQHPRPQGKLITVLQGGVYDVVVDVRRGSPTFGRWLGLELTAASMRQLYVPPGFAHGFVVLADDTLFSYKCTDYYRPETERTLIWNDPSVAVRWPLDTIMLSDKDRCGLTLGEFPPDALPTFAGPMAPTLTPTCP